MVSTLLKYTFFVMLSCVCLITSAQDFDVLQQNYLDSDGTIIWDNLENIEFNHNVTIIGRDDTSELNLKQSKSLNTVNDISIGIIDIETNNSLNTNSFFADKTFLVWGNNNGSITSTIDITKDFGASTGVTSYASATTISRKWKLIIKDSVPTVKLSIPESMLASTNTGEEKYIMIISDDDMFTTNVTSATMENVDNTLEVDFYFEGTKYITFGSTSEVSLGDRSVSFNGTDSYLSAGNVNDLANKNFTISAWVKRESLKFDILSKRDYFQENTENYTHGYALSINENGAFNIEWKDPNDINSNILQSSTNLPINEWHHVAATYNASEGALGTTRLYVDGILEDINDTLNPMEIPSDAHFIIGAAHYIKRQQRAKGNLDEVRVWDIPLSADQIRYIMNQEIEENDDLNADGKILPSSISKNEIASVPWNNLIAYYPMSTQVFGSIKDESNSGNDTSMINFDKLDLQTAPLPYISAQDGNWDTASTWLNGNVQYLPGTKTHLDLSKSIDYNIVQINHNVTMNNNNSNLIPLENKDNRTLLGLIINNNSDLEIEGDNSSNTGNSITVSHYLKIDGTLDLEGESQLIQTTGSDFDSSSKGNLERDQQGTTNTYRYNYWSSPVAPKSNSAYNTSNIISNVGFLTSGYNGTTSPVKNADYWIWKFTNNISNDYSQWKHVRSTGSISPAEGFTMKGPGTDGSNQNYIFSGQPNNGEISLMLAAGNDYLVGNPYPSAIDADTFLRDNLSIDDGGNNPNGSIINGTLYFWEHFAVNSHLPKDYQGGYATYTLMGGTLAVNNDVSIFSDEIIGTKLPERYIPVGQGFFVSTSSATGLEGAFEKNENLQPIQGGNLLFKNSQRVFQKENVSNSNIGSIFLKEKITKKVTQSTTVDDRQKIRIMFNSPEGYHRQLLIGIDENASNNFDLGYDGLLIEDNNEDLFWTLDDSKLIIQAVNSFNDTQIFPLGAKINKAGLATFRIDGLENIEDNLEILIHDKELDIKHNLKESNYETYLGLGNHLDRFELTFNTTSELLNTKDDVFSKVQLFYSNKKESIIVLNPNFKNIKTISVYNILGQSIYDFGFNTTENYSEIKTKNLKTGTYIIKIQAEGYTVSKKILVK